MSLYDKYHSEYNKTYMYNLIKKVCNSELKIDITDREDYKEYYEEQYPIIFEETKSEEITDINKELLDKMVSIIINDNQTVKKINKKYIYSSYDRIDLINQTCYDFKIDHDCDNVKISTIIIPESGETNINPLQKININDKEHIYTLSNTKNINKVEYYYFKNNEIISKNESLDIKIEHDFGAINDIIKVENIIINDNYIYVLLDKDISYLLEVKDKISFVSENKLIKNIFTIIKKDKKYIIINKKELEINKDELYILILKNQVRLLIE